eukprot:GFKZ01009810.1.p1 GENE.GFKZ01009810.1~~GFKZ01009810.1.p1  ORF type:complete len:112 (+),score=7.65 GFKZ01009810.1:773-1108(+)
MSLSLLAHLSGTQSRIDLQLRRWSNQSQQQPMNVLYRYCKEVSISASFGHRLPPLSPPGSFAPLRIDLFISGAYGLNTRDSALDETVAHPDVTYRLSRCASSGGAAVDLAE